MKKTLDLVILIIYIGYIVRISKYKNIFAKGYNPNWSEEVFLIKKVQKTVPWTNVISHVKGGRVFAKANQKEFRV